MITKLRPDQSSNSHFVSECCFIMFKLVSHTRGGANVMEKYLRPESICLCPCWPEFPFRNFCSIVFLSLNFLPQVLWGYPHFPFFKNPCYHLPFSCSWFSLSLSCLLVLSLPPALCTSLTRQGGPGALALTPLTVRGRAPLLS